LTIVFNV